MPYFTVFCIYNGLVKSVLLSVDTNYINEALKQITAWEKRKEITNTRLWSNVYQCWVPLQSFPVIHT